MLLLKKMGPKKGRKNVRKLEIPASDIQRTREEREQRERKKTENEQWVATGEGKGGSQEKGNSTVTHRRGSGRKETKN